MYREMVNFGIPIEARHIESAINSFPLREIMVLNVSREFIIKYQSEIDSKKIIIKTVTDEVDWEFFSKHVNYDKIRYCDIKYPKVTYYCSVQQNVEKTEKANKNREYFLEHISEIDWVLINSKFLGLDFIEEQLLNMRQTDMGDILAWNPYLEPELYEKYEHLVSWSMISCVTRCPIYLLEKHHLDLSLSHLLEYELTDEFLEQNLEQLLREKHKIWQFSSFKMVKKHFDKITRISDLYTNKDIPLYFLKKIGIPNDEFIPNENIPLSFFNLKKFSKYISYRFSSEPVNFKRQNFLDDITDRLNLLKIDF